MNTIFNDRLEKSKEWRDIGADMDENISEKFTIPSFTMETIKYFHDLKKSRVGGRAQLFNGKQKIISNDLKSMDCSGMYPYVMAVMKDAYYGSGKLIECKKFSEMPKDSIGFFYCKKINQSNIRLKITPEKNKDKTNNWDTPGVIDDMLLSTVKIDMLKKAGCKLQIKNGFYFSHKIKGCELFSFILDLMKHKSEEDIQKEKGKEYNAAKRQLIKGMMLIMSGKLAESLYLNKTEIVNITELNIIESTQKNVIIKNSISNKIVVSYDIPESDAIKNSQPIYLSTLIYDYSHKYMNDYMYSKISYDNLIMTDTDSCKLRNDDFILWKDQVKNIIVPHWSEVEKYDKRYTTSQIY